MRRPIVSLLPLAFAGARGITPGDFLVRNQQRFGFFRQDGPAVAAIIGFIRSR
jgi:hypothetical protein